MAQFWALSSSGSDPISTNLSACAQQVGLVLGAAVLQVAFSSANPSSQPRRGCMSATVAYNTVGFPMWKQAHL